MMTMKAEGISAACMIGIPAGTTIGIQARMSAGTADCTGIAIMAGTMASTTVPTREVIMTGIMAPTMTGMAVIPTTSRFGLGASPAFANSREPNRKNE